MDTAQILLLALLAGLVLWAVPTYQRVAMLRARVGLAFAQLDAQLERGLALGPSLVETAREHMEHERETLQAVILARNMAWHSAQAASQRPADPDAMRHLAAATERFADALGALMALARACPILQADPRLAALAADLALAEDRIAFARHAYDDAVTRFNDGIERFPARLFAGALRHAPSQ